MKSINRKKLLAAVAMGALVSLPSLGARAEDVAAEIRALKAKLKLLEEKLAQEEKQVKGIAKFPKMPPGEPPILCKDQECPPPPPVFVSFANGLKVGMTRLASRLAAVSSSTALPSTSSRT
jgi:hypothetical protein